MNGLEIKRIETDTTDTTDTIEVFESPEIIQENLERLRIIYDDVVKQPGFEDEAKDFELTIKNIEERLTLLSSQN